VAISFICAYVRADEQKCGLCELAVSSMMLAIGRCLGW
jgi:hypothetical protein